MFNLFALFNKKSDPVSFHYTAGEILPSLSTGYMFSSAHVLMQDTKPKTIRLTVICNEGSAMAEKAATLSFDGKSGVDLNKLFQEMKDKNITMDARHIPAPYTETRVKHHWCPDCRAKSYNW